MSASELEVRRWQATGALRGAVLVVHGLQEHSGRYSELAGRLTAAGFDVAAVDLYGHGKSPGRRGHLESFEGDHLGAVDLLVRHAEQRDPDVRPFLLGHSLGGLITIRWAQSRVFADRLRGLVLISPFVAPSMPVPGWKEALSRLAGRLRPTFRLRTGIADEDVFRDDAEAAAFAADPLVQRYISAAHWNALSAERERLRESAPLEVPMLFLLAGDDRIVDSAAAAAFAARQREATVIEYGGAYHALHHDPVADAMFADLTAWMEARSNT